MGDASDKDAKQRRCAQVEQVCRKMRSCTVGRQCADTSHLAFPFAATLVANETLVANAGRNS